MLRRFSVRIRLSSGRTSLTVVEAENSTAAAEIARMLYGAGNVMTTPKPAEERRVG